jgi:hypothetical protein
MDYGQMNLGSWSSYLPVFKNVLRPSSAVDPVSDMGMFPADLNEAITQARTASPGFAQLGDTLVDLVFNGYQDWYGYDDTWILQQLGQVLDDQGAQEDGLLSRLDAIVTAAGSDSGESALTEFLSYAERCADTWQQEAAAEGYTSEDTGDAAVLEGTPNDANWEASRTPGTRYYIYYDERYLYSDEPSGPLSIWEDLPAREDKAAENAYEWEGVNGWWCTSTNDKSGMYGGEFVFAKGTGAPEGPWMTYEQAEQLIAHPGIADSGVVDLSIPEQAQQAASDVAAAAENILRNVLSRNPKAAEDIDPERLKQLALEALKAQT